MKIKTFLAGALLSLTLAATSACTHYSAVAQGPTPEKVFITKTTSYIIWSVNKMEVCDYSNNVATNCSEVTEK